MVKTVTPIASAMGLVGLVVAGPPTASPAGYQPYSRRDDANADGEAVVPEGTPAAPSTDGLRSGEAIVPGGTHAAPTIDPILSPSRLDGRAVDETNYYARGGKKSPQPEHHDDKQYECSWCYAPMEDVDDPVGPCDICDGNFCSEQCHTAHTPCPDNSQATMDMSGRQRIEWERD